MIAGLMAGILAFGVGKVWGEPPVAAAIAIEEAGSAAQPTAEAPHDHGHAEAIAPAGHSHGDDEASISRDTQAGIGLLTGMAVFGVALGGLFALAFALVQGRFSHLSAQATAAAMALIGYVTVVLVPFLKYPANPPAVGHGETIGLRTQMFFAMMVLSLLAAVIAVAVARAGRDRWRSGLMGCATFIALVVIAGSALPVINEVPASFPADLLWQFRTIALIVQAVLWAGIGLFFGLLVEKFATEPVVGGRVIARS